MLKNFMSFSKCLLLEYNNPKEIIDLETEYDRLNEELFNGKLERIPIKWEKVKNSGGRVVYTYQKINGVETNKIQYLGMSSYYEKTYKDFLNILAHEMIHVYIIQNNIKDTDTHGVIFRKMMDEINSKGYNINIYDDVTGRKMTNVDNLKSPVAVVMVYDVTSDVKSIAVLDYKIYNPNIVESIEKALTRLSKIYNKKYDLIIVYTYNGKLRKYTIKRTLKVLETVSIDDELWDELLQDKKNIELHKNIIKN